jgi:hypothetical protein
VREVDQRVDFFPEDESRCGNPAQQPGQARIVAERRPGKPGERGLVTRERDERVDIRVGRQQSLSHRGIGDQGRDFLCGRGIAKRSPIGWPSL